jgi:hypothetical protein
MSDPDNLAGVACELLETLDLLQKRGFADEEVMQKARTLDVRLAPAYERIGYGSDPVHTQRTPPYLWWPGWREKVANVLAMLEGRHPKLKQAKEASVASEAFDVAQICRNGQMINSTSVRLPEHN